MHSDNTLLANGRAMVRDWHHDADTVPAEPEPGHRITSPTWRLAQCAGRRLSKWYSTIRRPAWTCSTGSRETGATYVMGVPTHAMDTARRRCTGAALPRSATLRCSTWPAPPIPPRSRGKPSCAIGIKPQNVYGMTENGSHQYTLPSDDTETIVAHLRPRVQAATRSGSWRQDDRDGRSPRARSARSAGAARCSCWAISATSARPKSLVQSRTAGS